MTPWPSSAGSLRPWPAAELAYKKLDSLLRGNTVAEIAACFRLGAWPHCVVAPAFPYQGRITRGGRQFAKGPDGWSAVSDDLVAALAAHGLPVQKGHPEVELGAGVSVFDAENESDLDRVVAIGGCAKGPVLWCGSGGLARALARGTDPNVSTPCDRRFSGCSARTRPSPRASSRPAESTGCGFPETHGVPRWCASAWPAWASRSSASTFPSA